ncbi:MAG: cytochrome P460 family protein [Gemmataceae bacterium]
MIVFFTLLFLWLSAFVIAGPRFGPAEDTDPRYREKELIRPDGYRTWVFVGANIGLRYSKEDKSTTERESDRHKDSEIGDFHNVYINPKAYDQFKKNGTFPDGTVLVMDVYESKDREPKGIVEKGFFPGKQKEIEVAVKDSKRPDGAKEDWAYYIFPPDKKTAMAMPKVACYECHLKHGKTDNVWVQFYPTLRDKR